MVTDHRRNLDRQTATRSPHTGCASRHFQRTYSKWEGEAPAEPGTTAGRATAGGIFLHQVDDASGGSLALPKFCLATMLLCVIGCQSVVDPGRSMNSARPPQGAVIQGTPPVPVVPPAMSPTPQVPAAPSTNPAGVIRQPASSIIQLPQAAAGESKYHTVVAGDNWASIARQYRMTVQELTDANGIDPATKLQPGQLVYIPQK
jgi:LysM repeat protein